MWYGGSAAAALFPPSALAHDGQPLAPHDLWSAWSFEPVVLGSLALSGWFYLRGIRALWRHTRRGRGIHVWEAAAFAAGWLVLAIALVSPLHQVGGVLFSAHMTQHELLMVVAAPLLVLGRPIIPFLWALSVPWRRTVGSWSANSVLRGLWRLLTRPLVAWTVHGGAIWLWHAPTLYEASVRSEAAHSLQHASFLLSALLFWWSLLHGREGRLGRPAAVVYLFTTALHTSLLGALLTFSSRVWYGIHDSTTAAWGLTGLEDQQIAGLIMWIPAGVAYLIAALGLAYTWLRQPEPRMIAGGGLRATFPVLLVALLLMGCNRGSALAAAEAARLTGGDPKQGAQAIREYGCGSCHTIPGIPGANSLVGPPLTGIGGRSFIAGVLSNSPANLTRWIQDPQGVDSLTAMPDVGVTESSARDIAAYLYTLR